MKTKKKWNETNLIWFKSHRKTNTLQLKPQQHTADIWETQRERERACERDKTQQQQQQQVKQIQLKTNFTYLYT